MTTCELRFVLLPHRPSRPAVRRVGHAGAGGKDYSGKSGKLRPTPAMMAGLTDRLWSFEDLYDAVTR